MQMAKAKGKSVPVPAVRKAAPAPAAKGHGYESVAGAGFETATADAYALPRLYILQKGSPQVNEKNAEYVDGAKPGMFFNPVSKELYDTLSVVVVLYRRTYVEWVKREDGGGFVAEHQMVNPKWLKDARGPYTTAEDHIVNDSRNFFILFGEGRDDLMENAREVIISLTSSNLQVAANLMTVLGNKRGKRVDGSTFQLPMYASILRMETEYRENDKGDWYRYRFVDPAELVPDDSALFETAKAYHAKISSGAVTMAKPADENPDAETI